MEVHIVTSGRLELLKKCLRSVVAALIPEASVMVFVNGDHPETETWLREETHPAVRWKRSPRVPLTVARNNPLDESPAELIHFLDDDVLVPPHLFRFVFDYFAGHPEVAIVGGPNPTPPESRWREKLYGAVMTSYFASPMVRARYGGGRRRVDRPTNELELMFCNLAVRKTAVPPSIRLRVGLKSNEENLFVHECGKAGLRAMFLMNAYAFHHRRSDFRSFLRQLASYGFGRAQQTLIRPDSLHPFFLAPAALWIYLACCAAAPAFRQTLPGTAALYALGAVTGALESRHIRALGPFGVLFAIPLTAVVHAAYGFGFWRGIVRGRVSKRGAR